MKTPIASVRFWSGGFASETRRCQAIFARLSLGTIATFVFCFSDANLRGLSKCSVLPPRDGSPASIRNLCSDVHLKILLRRRCVEHVHYQASVDLGLCDLCVEGKLL